MKYESMSVSEVCLCACVPSKLLCLLQSHHTVWNSSAAFCRGATWGQNALAFNTDSLIMTPIKVTGSTPLPNFLFKLHIQWHIQWGSLPCKTNCIMTLKFIPTSSQRGSAFGQAAFTVGCSIHNKALSPIKFHSIQYFGIDSHATWENPVGFPAGILKT